MTFTLRDPATDKIINVEVEAVGTFLNLRPTGYGNPVSLDFYGGRLCVLVNDDPDEEEPTIIELTPDPGA